MNKEKWSFDLVQQIAAITMYDKDDEDNRIILADLIVQAKDIMEDKK